MTCPLWVCLEPSLAGQAGAAWRSAEAVWGHAKGPELLAMDPALWPSPPSFRSLLLVRGLLLGSGQPPLKQCDPKLVNLERFLYQVPTRQSADKRNSNAIAMLTKQRPCRIPHAWCGRTARTGQAVLK